MSYQTRRPWYTSADGIFEAPRGVLATGHSRGAAAPAGPGRKR
jgi:hypothetical protein